MSRPTVCLVVLVLLGAAGAQGHVTLFRDGNYRGASQTFYNDIPDLRQSSIGNDQASSLQVTSGCLVRLYKDIDYRGAFTELDRNEPDLGSSAVGNDNVSSLRIVCGGGISWEGGRAPDRVSAGVALYRDSDFRSTREVFHGDLSDLRGTQIGNDQASSVKVAPGCRVRLYADAGFRGTYEEMSGAASDLRRSRVGNDKVSSLEVRCVGDNRPWNTGSSGSDTGSGSHDWGDWNEWDGNNGRGVVLFQHRDFNGRSQTIYRDEPNLSGPVGAYEASSIRVPSDCVAYLYSIPNFEGNAVRLNRSEHYLGDTRVGNDRAASIRVDCGGGSSGGSSGGNDPWGWHEDGRWGVTLYADSNFRGASETFDHDIQDMRRESDVGNDRVSSVRVPRGCRVALYADPDFRGAYVVLHDDTRDLSFTQIGNDSVSSLRVDCH